MGRGGAQTDFDADGKIDLILPIQGGQVIVLRNVSGLSSHWLCVRLRQPGGNTYGLGARAYVTCGRTTFMGEVGASSSYMSQDEMTLRFGLGEASVVEKLRIVWPDGSEETHTNLACDTEITFTRDASPL